MKRLLAIVGLSVLIAAASPADVVSELETAGFFIESGASATPEVVGDAVAEAGFEGSRLYVVVLAQEPASGATFFSDAVLDDLGSGTVFTVAPETVGWASVGDIWSNEQLDEALDTSLDGSTDDEVVELFVSSLTSGSPPDPGESGSSGGGGSGWIWLLVLGGGLVLMFVFLRNRSNATAANARDARLREFYATAQAKLNDIANDILDMEDEVNLSEDLEVKEHYDSASGTYAQLIDTVPRATSADDLAEIVYQLDIAIWELDVAEALLDGKTAPERPQKPEIEQPPNSPPVITSTPPQPSDFERRSRRQSSPAGPDLGNILLAILAAQGFGGRASGTWGQPGSHPPGGGFPGGPGGGGLGGRMRGGGRRRG